MLSYETCNLGEPDISKLEPDHSDFYQLNQLLSSQLMVRIAQFLYISKARNPAPIIKGPRSDSVFTR